MFRRFCLQPDSNICFRGQSWCEQEEGVGKYQEGYASDVNMVKDSMSYVLCPAPLPLISDAWYSRLESDMRAEDYLIMVGEKLVYCPSYSYIRSLTGHL